MATGVKICGISSLATARTAIEGGADFLGFIHFARSPRHLGLEAMAELMRLIRAGARKTPLVSVVVDPDDALLDRLADEVRPDLVQLHGEETPQRVADIAGRFPIPLIKAIGVGDASDLARGAAYAAHVRHLMFDARPPPGATLPGGIGLSFDWTLLHGHDSASPWFLAGGLTPENVARAVKSSGASIVDVSSGVESAPGVKDAGLISRFLQQAKSV